MNAGNRIEAAKVCISTERWARAWRKMEIGFYVNGMKRCRVEREQQQSTEREKNI